MIFSPEMTREDAILVATSTSAGTQTRVLSYDEERAIVVADRENRFFANLAGMTRRTAGSLCG